MRGTRLQCSTSYGLSVGSNNVLESLRGRRLVSFTATPAFALDFAECDRDLFYTIHLHDLATLHGIGDIYEILVNEI